MTPSDVKATLSFSDGSPSMDLPIYNGTRRSRRDRHPQAVRADRQVHLRPGLPSRRHRASSTITYIDGDKGELLYRGYPIEQLAVKCDFLETCHLLLYGELPNTAAAGRLHEAA